MPKQNHPSATRKHGLVTPKASVDSLSSEDANDNLNTKTTSQSPFGTQAPIHEEPAQMDQPPSELPTQKTTNSAATEPIRAATDPVPGQYPQQDEPSASNPSRSQSQTLPQGRILYTSPPTQTRGHLYKGDVIISGDASVISGNIYDSDGPPSCMASHEYIGRTIIKSGNVNFHQGDHHGPSLEKRQFWHRRG